MTVDPGTSSAGSDPASPAKPRARSVAIWVLAVVALIIQALAAYIYVIMGLGWGGLWFVLAAGQGVVIFTVMVILLVLRSPRTTLGLPVLSASLMLACLMIDGGLDLPFCSPEALAAVNTLREPPDVTEPLEFEHETGIGCAVHFDSRLSEAQFTQHYVDEGRRGGWEVVENIPAQSVVLHNAGWIVTAGVNTEDTGRYIVSIQQRD